VLQPLCGRNPGPRGRILIADDEPALLRALARLLGTSGYEVKAVDDGARALEALDTEDFDVIVSDISMPGMDGLKLLRTARERDLDIPVVLMTGAPAVETAIQALEYGAFQYLTKPIDGAQLDRVLDRAVRMRKMARMRREAQVIAAHDEAIRRDLESSFARMLDAGKLHAQERALVDPWR
jgi:DNA-binding NtrC family response regulator